MRLTSRFFVVALVAVGTIGWGVWAAEMVHIAAGAGVIYPSDSHALQAKLRGLFNAADPPRQDVRLVACVVPHSSYDLSGVIAAHAFKHIAPGQYTKVLILAPSRSTTFEGCSIASVQAYATPLGLVPVDLERVKHLSRCPLIAARALRYKGSDIHTLLHEREYTVEAVLPFLQGSLGQFKLIPILVGQLLDDKGKINENIYDLVADTIRPVIDEQTLIVVSAEFTAYGNDFSYRPFQDSVPERIQELDFRAFQLLMRHDFSGFLEYLEKTRNPVMGREALLLLTKLLPRHTRAQVLAYAQSGDITGNPNRSVSYAAINFYDPTQSPTGAPTEPGKPEKRDTVVLKMKGSEQADGPPQREVSGAPIPRPAAEALEGSGATTVIRMKGAAGSGEAIQREISGAPIQPGHKPKPANTLEGDTGASSRWPAGATQPAAFTAPVPSSAPVAAPVSIAEVPSEPGTERPAADGLPPESGLGQSPGTLPEEQSLMPPGEAAAIPEGVGFEEWAGLDKREPVVLKLEGASKDEAPVVLKMKGSKAGDEPVRIEVHGTPPVLEGAEGAETSGRVTYMSGPRKKKAAPDQEEAPSDE